MTRCVWRMTGGWLSLLFALRAGNCGRAVLKKCGGEAHQAASLCTAFTERRQRTEDSQCSVNMLKARSI